MIKFHISDEVQSDPCGLLTLSFSPLKSVLITLTDRPQEVPEQPPATNHPLPLTLVTAEDKSPMILESLVSSHTHFSHDLINPTLPQEGKQTSRIFWAPARRRRDHRAKACKREGDVITTLRPLSVSFPGSSRGWEGGGRTGAFVPPRQRISWLLGLAVSLAPRRLHIFALQCLESIGSRG